MGVNLLNRLQYLSEMPTVNPNTWFSSKYMISTVMVLMITKALGFPAIYVADDLRRTPFINPRAGNG